jgi:hypothetical protein
MDEENRRTDIHISHTYDGHVPSFRFGKEIMFQKLAMLQLTGKCMGPTKMENIIP